MTKFLALIAAIIAVSVAPAFAQDTASSESSPIPGEFSANVALTSDYIFRGISQSDEGPAIQGGFDYSYLLGTDAPSLYAGVWGSNVDFNDDDEANVEIDVYAGLKGSFSSMATDWKVGGIYYAYPGADDSLDYDYWEATVGLSHDFGPFALTGDLYYSPEFFGETGDAWYTSGGVSIPLPYDFSLNGHVGYQTIEDGEDYLDWSAGIGYSWSGFNFSVNYIDTDLEEPEECADGCDARVVFTVSKSF